MQRGLDDGGPTGGGAGRRRDKARLRILDACLQELENAHEKDELILSPALAERLRAHVPALAPRMKIADAIDVVFQEQLQHLLCDESEALTERPPAPASAPPAELASSSILRLFGEGVQGGRPGHGRTWPPLDEAAAQALTEEIRRASRQLSVLLLEAHERYAWSALGYRTWEQYVKSEFGLSRTRSYELLDQGRVMLAIKVVSGSSEMPDVSAYAALQIKPYLDEFLEVVRCRTANLLPDRIPEMIAGTVREFRNRLPSRSRTARLMLGCTTEEPGRGPSFRQALPAVAGVDPSRLSAAIEYVASLPPAQDVASRLPSAELPELRGVMRAVRWLTELALACEDRQGQELVEEYVDSRAAP